MKAIIYFLLVPISFCFAKSEERVFKYFSNNKYEIVKTTTIKGLEVNESCIKNSSCRALKIAKGKRFKFQQSNAPTLGNPGASYCWDVGAKNRLLKDKNNRDYDFCVFEDGSMIDAWSLYYAHYPQKRIK